MEPDRARQLLANERERIEQSIANLGSSDPDGEESAPSPATKSQRTCIRTSSTPAGPRTSRRSSRRSSVRRSGSPRARTGSRSRAASRSPTSGSRSSRPRSARSRRKRPARRGARAPSGELGLQDLGDRTAGAEARRDGGEAAPRAGRCRHDGEQLPERRASSSRRGRRRRSVRCRPGCRGWRRRARAAPAPPRAPR